MSTTHRTCARFLFLALAFLLGGAPRLLADVTVDDGSPDTFEDALIELGAAGGTITVTFPITIDDTRIFEVDGDFGSVTIDGQDTNGLFIVNGTGDLTLDGFVLTGGRSTNGGAIYIDFDARVEVTNCVFTGNIAIGTNGLTGANGSAGSTGDNGTRGGAADPARGGAIYNLGELVVGNCQFLTNSAIGGDGGAGGNGGNGAFQGGNGGSGGAGGFALGGAIYNTGFITVVDSTFDSNKATGGDGGDGGDGGTGALPGIIGNGAPAGYATGAGIYTDSTNTDTVVLITGSTFSENVAQGGDSGSGANKFGSGAPRGAQGAGGGVANVGFLNVENSTFFRNSALGGNGGDGGKGGSGGAAFGGGIFNTGGVAVAFCTFSSSSAIGGTNGAPLGIILVSPGKQGKGQGGNLAHVNPKLGYFTLRDSIVGTNLGGGAASGKIQDNGRNIISDKSIKVGSGSLKKTDAKLGPLADNGGPTFTIAIAIDSPARDFGPIFGSPDYFFFDQRGVLRDGTNDVGAYEFITSPPQITLTSQPDFRTNLAFTVIQTNGGPVTLTATVLGDPPFSYRWYALTNGSGTNVQVKSTSNSQLFQNSLSITNLSTNNAGFYHVVVSNKFGATFSPDVHIIVSNSTAVGPAITTQPTDQTVSRGDTATFSVAATGDAPLFYQWRFNGTNVGANTNFFQVFNTQTTNIGSYTVVITNAVGSATSSTATINMLPFITVQPTNQTVGLTSNVTLTVTAGGSPTLTYKWYHNGIEAPGGGSPSLIKSSAGTNDSGDYFVIVANSFGSIQSATATITVTSAAPGAPFVPQNTSSGISVPPPVISAPAISSGAFTFSFLSQAGVTYDIQSSDTLGEDDWTTIDTTVGTGDWLTNDIPATNSRRFFRVLVR